jgi:serine/threonine-protein kinase
MLEGRRLGPYLLERRLGGGGMASVYLGRHQTLKHERAVKVMSANLAGHEGFVQLFYREARLSARLRHPNVVRTYDVGEHDGAAYLVMELLEGRSLHDVIRQDRPLSVERAVHFVEQLAAALDYAHAQGVVHRDVKPANAFVSPGDHLTLVDFGIARAADGTRLSITHGIGTPEYMAPEIFDERLQRPGADDHQRGMDADLYALGVVAYELLTGRLPFSGRTPQAFIFEQVHRPPEALRRWRPELSERLEVVVLGQLAKRPTERCGRALEFAARLAEATRDQTRRDHEERVTRVPEGATSRVVRKPFVAPRPGRAGSLLRAGRVRAGVFALAVLGVVALASLYALSPSRIGGVARTEAAVTPVAIAARAAPTAVETPAPTFAAREATATVALPTPTIAPSTPTPAPGQVLLSARAALEAGEVLRAMQILTALKQSNAGLPGLDDALVDAHLKLGQNLLDEGQVDASWGQYEAALALRPGSDEAERGKQRIVLMKEWARMEGAWSSAPDVAVAALEAILKLDGDYRDGEARSKLYALLIARADRLLEGQERDEAFAALTRALELRPEGEEVRMRLRSYTPTPLPTATAVPIRTVPPPAQSAPAQPAPNQPPPQQPQPQPQQPQQPVRMPGRPV